MKTWLIAAGAVVAVVGLLNMFSVPLEIPTKNDGVNIAIGAGLVGVGLLL